MIVPVILAGGSGTRLWPLSRKNFPKQFLCLDSEHTMLQSTIKRLEKIDHSASMIICNEEHRFVAAEQMRQAGQPHSGIFLESKGRNTAPAIAIAAFNAIRTNEDSTLLILPADHFIQNEAEFLKSFQMAKLLANTGKLVTFGIVPTHAETGYGYINRGKRLASGGYSIDSFVEKPDKNTAEQYLSAGNYLWNSGMFVFKAKAFLSELKLLSPDIYKACLNAVEKQSVDGDFIRVCDKQFELCPEDSIDYAVMEKTANAAVVPMNANWSDVGGYASLWDVSPKDENGNVNKGDVITIDSSNNLIFSQNKLVAAVGLSDLAIVETKDVVLVTTKEKSANVKEIVHKLKEMGRTETDFHREVYRPWGHYDSVDSGERFQVKRITVKPGAKLSVQMHHHRAEHWIVVQGTAKVQNGDREILLTENQSTYIPVGVVHSLENPGKVPLELIEVQSGSYLGEDDIVRFEDKYGRN